MPILNIFNNTCPTLKACMLGPRAVGKTTVLTSIFAESQDKLAGSRLYIRPSASHINTGKLTRYRILLENAISNNDPAALPASMDETDFLFEIGLSGRPQANVNLLIKDYPGEYLTSPDKKAKVTKFVEEANIIIVAIDAPYMMEGEELDKAKNNPELVKSFLHECGDRIKNKLVLLIPLKCERFFHDGKAVELANKVKADYGDMENFFHEHNIASDIIPIQTLGGVEFDRMIPNPQPIDISHISLFRMYGNNPKYAPLLCAQPLYYLLSYVAHYTEWTRAQRRGFFDRLNDLITSFLRRDQEFFTEICSLRNSIIIGQLGCEVFTNNSIFRL